jgi:hypothetical protein
MKRFAFATLVGLAVAAAPGVALAQLACSGPAPCGSSGQGRCCVYTATTVYCSSGLCPAAATYPGDAGISGGKPCAQNTNGINGTPAGPTLEGLFPNCD